MPIREPEDDEGDEIQDAEAVDGCDVAETEVRAFIKQKMVSPDVERAVLFTVCTTARNKLKGAEGDQVGECTVQIGDEPDSFARILVEQAEGHARNFFGKTRYIVRATEPALRGSITFTLTRVGGEAEDEEIEGEVENLELPTFRGMANQAMRHTEGAHREMRFFARDSRQSLAYLQQVIRQRDERISMLEGKLDKYQSEIEAVRNMDHARNLDFKTWEKSQARLDGAFEMFGNVVLPAIGQHLIPKLLGGGGEAPQAAQAQGQPQAKNPAAAQAAQAAIAALRPEQRTPIEKAAEALVNGVDRAQVDALRKILTPSQFEALGALHEMVADRREREQKAKTRYAEDVAKKATAKAPPTPSTTPPGGMARSAYARTG